MDPQIIYLKPYDFQLPPPYLRINHFILNLENLFFIG